MLFPVRKILTVTGWSHPDSPEVCESKWRTRTPSLRFWGNSGQ